MSVRWAFDRGLVGLEFAHQIEDRAVEDLEAGTNGGVAEGLGEKTFPHPWRA